MKKDPQLHKSTIQQYREAIIIKNKPGVVFCAKHMDTPKKAFQIFIPSEFISKIVNFTNK